MIKFRGQDGTDKFAMKDNGELDFTDSTEKEKFEKAEDSVNKEKDK